MPRARWILLVVALLGTAVLGVALGPLSLSPRELWEALLGRGDSTSVVVVRTLRAPRVVLAALVGGALGLSGAALQGAMRNALAEPYLLGVSGGAAVGAVVAVALGLGAAFLPLAAFAGAIAAVVLAFFVARAGVRGDPRVLLMAGVIVGAFANAVIMIVLANARADTVRSATWWMMGSAADATWRGDGWLLLYTILGAAALLAWGRRIDVLALGDDTAAAMGLDVAGDARRIYAAASLLAAATVAAAGLIGFVGLVVPHIVRHLGVRGHRALLGGSALCGAALVVAADVVARVAWPPAELPLGAVTAVIGVPFFLAQLRRLA